MFFATLFFVPVCAGGDDRELVEKFLGYLKAKNYGEAVAIFSDELRFQCSEQELSTIMNSIVNDEIYIYGKNKNIENQLISGELQSFDAVKQTAHPNGILYGAILRFKNFVLQCRVAVDNGKITAFEFLDIPNEPVSDNVPCLFNGTEIGKILGYDCSIRVTFIDDNGKKPVVSNGSLTFTLFHKIDALPPKHENENNIYWTDPKNGSHWKQFIFGNYSERDYENCKEGIFQYNGLPAGTYRVEFNNRYKVSSAESGKIGLTGAIQVGKENKNADVTQKLIEGGRLRLHAIDADSGETIKDVQIDKLTCDQFPSQNNGNRQQYHEHNIITQLFPGRYTFSVSKIVRTPEDRICTPMEEKYETEIVDGKETVVEVKLRSRPQTEKELNEHWKFIITGTVCDPEGKPLPFAKIKIKDYSPRFYSKIRETSVVADKNGYYKLRFSNEMITYFRNSEKPTPENPNVLEFTITAEHAGFVWKGIRTANGQIISDQFLIKNEKKKEINEFLRNDFHKMYCVEPEPTDQIKKTRNYHYDNVAYPLKPAEINIVMQPSVHFNGVVEFEEQPESEKPDMRNFWKHAEVIFDLPHEERASSQPVFYGDLNNDFRFAIDVLPQNIGFQFNVSSLLPQSWQKDTVVAKTDFFKLPPTGIYNVVLYWKTETKNGAAMRQLAVKSLTDANGQKIDTEFVKPAQPTDFLFNRWKFAGILRDNLGNPIPDAEVKLFRYNRYNDQNFETLKTDAEGKFTVSEIKPFPFYEGDKRNLTNGEFIAVCFNKDGFLQKEQFFENEALLIFLSDVENPQQKLFFNNFISTERVVEPRKIKEFEFVLHRCPVVECILVDAQDKPMTGYSLEIQTNTKNQIQRNFRFNIKTDREGRFVVNKILPEIPLWFQLWSDLRGEGDIFRTNNIVFQSGEKYNVKLRLRKEPDNSKRLTLESVQNSTGKDITKEIVTEDWRTRPLLGEEETKKGRDILQKTVNAVRPVFEINTNEIELISYNFYLGDEVNEFSVNYPYRGHKYDLSMGITFSDPVTQFHNSNSLSQIRFRAIETNENEIRLLTTQSGYFSFGNGVTESWRGYISGNYGWSEFVLDAKTFLPKLVKTNQSETEYFDWTPLGNPDDGQFVPKRIICKSGGMIFDFRFKIHRQDVWLFDRSVVTAGNNEETICRIDNVQIKRIVWASNEDENRVRDLLRKYNDANKYWLTLYPNDLPKFGYTFHRQGADDKVLSYEAVKAATNWYAEFYRKGISYIGVSRLLVIDIDALRCTRVAENIETGTLEFDFVLKYEWMNAVGNGIIDSWLGWFNGGVERGTAIFDTKTNTVKEIRTKNYDERFSDYYEIKQGQFVPRRIVIDYHKGNKSKSDKMFFDFRFKIYEPCLWLFDHSVKPDEKDFPVWIDNVLVEGKPAVEMK
ncbi:MAG: carboxypeptidase-like regulatory domain-containing protein [Planctomycetaceae bacterium]|nr:carboxypeptidase-like regulatory domain-containing protein [Planctomycetaceae bacterium]